MTEKNRLHKESLDEFLKNFSFKYGYYYDDSFKNPFKQRKGLNCSDNADKRMAIEFIKKEIVREATPEELEWIKKQPKVDIEEHPELKPILKWLLENIF